MKMSRRAQASLEVAVFGSLMLVALLAGLSYKRILSEQNSFDQGVWKLTVNAYHSTPFSWTDEFGQTQTAQGAVYTLTKHEDRQANNLFQPQKRSSAASYTVYDSIAEDPPDYAKEFYNEQEVNLGNELKLFKFRSGSAFGAPREELKLTTAEIIAILFPTAVSALGKGLSVIFNFQNWWARWGNVITWGVRVAAFTYLATQISRVFTKLTAVEDRWRQLETQDEYFGEVCGWRVATYKDGSTIAGKQYVKEVSPYVWDQQANQDRDSLYTETRTETPASIVNTRSVQLSDGVHYILSVRYDTTDCPVSALSSHTYQDAGQRSTVVGLGGTQSETWTTPK